MIVAGYSGGIDQEKGWDCVAVDGTHLDGKIVTLVLKDIALSLNRWCSAGEKGVVHVVCWVKH